MSLEKLFILFFINKIRLHPSLIDKATYSSYIHFINELKTLPESWVANICRDKLKFEDKNCAFLNYIKKDA